MGSAVFLTTQLAHAQVGVGPERDAAEQRRALERETQLREQQDHTPDIRLPKPPSEAPRLLPDSETPCFTIQQLVLRGEESARFAWILDTLGGADGLDSPQNKCLGAKGIAVVLQRAQDAVVARGFVTTRVLTEPQDLSSGKLTLTVLPGRIRSIRFADPVDPRATAWNAVPAKPGDILNLRDIEQALENFKRIPSAEADIQVEPAQAPGTSDLVISWKQTMPFRLSLTADDGGSKGTGKNQGSITLSYDHWWTLNDLFYITYNRNLAGTLSHSALRSDAAGDATDGKHGTEGHTVHYSIPWGYWLLGFTQSRNSYYQSVAGANQNIIYSGTSSNADIKLSRLIYRDQTHKTTVSVKAFQRTSNNYIDDTEVGVQRRIVGGWEAALAERAFFGAATLDTSVAFKHGTGAFGALPAPEESFGEGTSRFQLATADVNLNAPFDLVGHKLRYSANWRAQWNHTPLTPQDRFAIGGRYTVRGFDGESSLSAEHGWLIRQELSTALGASGQELFVGLDHGKVGGPSSDTLVGKRLTGAVLGLRGSAKGLGYELFAGQPVKQPEGFKTARTTAGFSLNMSF